MTWFEQLETHLHDLYLLNLPYAVDAFKPAFRSFFGEEHQTFKLKMFQNLDQFRLQLERENLDGVNTKTCWQQDFEDFTHCEPRAYRRELLENLDTLEAIIHRVVNTYGVLRLKENEVNALMENGSQLHDEILHEHQIKSSVKMQSQDIHINPVQAIDDSLIHTEQSEPNYDTHLLETIDSNTTPTSTNMCHRGGEIDQDALLNAELLKTKDMVCMEVYNELSKRFLQLEKHCISLEISIQQKEESFHSNKPCKNKEYPEFREFFVINDLKAQLQA
ncbi:hypothetical protein Tco_1097636 [Tanacetum coccineum]